MKNKWMVCMAAVGSILLLSDAGASQIENAEGAMADQVSIALREASRSAAPLKSLADVDLHLRDVPATPLLALNEDQRRRFVNSLVFTDKGLASYSWLSLTELSIVDRYRILALFGAQNDLTKLPYMPVKSEAEESMIFLASLQDGLSMTQRNSVCWVREPNVVRCEYEYGANCDPNACRPR